MEPTFLNLSRANRIVREMGLEMAEGKVFRYASDYTYIEIPLLHALNADGEPVDKATRNQAIELVAAATLKPGYHVKILVLVNPTIYKYGMAPSMVLFDEKERTPVVVPVTFRKDMQLTGLDWLVRLYLFS